MRTNRHVVNLFAALLVAVGVATADDNDDSAQVKRIEAAQLLLKENRPGVAIESEINDVIAYFENKYSDHSYTIYCARTNKEKMAYLERASSEAQEQEAMVISATWSMAYYLKAYALMELGRPADARSYLAKALKSSPFNSIYLSESGHYYQQEKNWKEANKVFIRAAECARIYSPDDVRLSELSRALRGRGYCLVEMGQLDEAEAIYLECLKLNPDDAIARDELEYTQDQKIFQAAHVSPGMIAEIALFSELSPLGGLTAVSRTNELTKNSTMDADAILAAAEKGDAPSQFELGLIYGNGQGAFQDYAKAAKWFRMAAEQGHTRAQYCLGVMNVEGLGMTKDEAEAIKWFRQSAENGDARGEFGLGMAYAEGIGVPQNDKEAAKWFLKSAKQGDAGAQHNLGVLPFRGKGVESDAGEWVQWHLKAAEQGNPKAETIIGYLYGGGMYLPKDPVESAKWYRRAAQQGEPFAQSGLGLAYALGEGVAQDNAEAVKWLRKAAEKGQVKAQSNLGAMYCNGYGVSQDYAEGLKWYQMAAEEGNGDAMDSLGTMYLRGDGVQQDFAEAMKWYRKAAEYGNIDALYEVGLMYFRGNGVTQNNSRAIRWIQAAAERGHPKAKEIVQGMKEAQINSDQN